MHTAEELVAIVIGDGSVAPSAASLAEFPDALWIEAARNHPEAGFALAQSKHVPTAALEQLALDPDPRVRSMVAMKRKGTPALLRRLAHDANTGVRLAVAYNRSTPRDVLELLARDEWDEVSIKSRSRLADGADRSAPTQ